MLDIERSSRSGARQLAAIPYAWLRVLRPIIPTLIYRIERMDK